METQWSNALTILRNFEQSQEGEQGEEQAQEGDENLAETNADALLEEDPERDETHKLSVHSDEQKDHSRTMRNSAIAYWRYGHERYTSEPTGYNAKFQSCAFLEEKNPFLSNLDSPGIEMDLLSLGSRDGVTNRNQILRNYVQSNKYIARDGHFTV